MSARKAPLWNIAAAGAIRPFFVFRTALSKGFGLLPALFLLIFYHMQKGKSTKSADFPFSLLKMRASQTILIPDDFYMTDTADVNRDGFQSVSGTLRRSDAEQTIVSGVPTLA